MKLRGYFNNFSASSLLCAVLFVTSAFADAPPGIHPLAPPDRSSPRATLETFLDEMNRAVHAYAQGDHKTEALASVQRAEQCLDVEQLPASLRFMIGFYASLFLKETLDRIEIPPYEDIPDAKAVQADKITSWTIPYTDITIAAVKDASSIQRFMFTPETVRRSEKFYDRVKDLPSLSGDRRRSAVCAIELFRRPDDPEGIRAQYAELGQSPVLRSGGMAMARDCPLWDPGHGSGTRHVPVWK